MHNNSFLQNSNLLSNSTRWYRWEAYIDKALFEAEKLLSEYDKKISKMEIGYILMHKSIIDSINLTDLFKNKGDQNEYLENLCFRYIEKNGLKKAIERIDCFVNEEFKIIWVQAILENLPTQKASFQYIKPLMKHCMKYPELLSEILIKNAVYNSFYSPKTDYKILYSLNSIIDIHELLCFVPISNSD